MPKTDNLLISGGGGAKKRRRSSKTRASPAKRTKYATAKTQAGKYRQVWEGRADITGPGGLKKSQLTQSSSGKIVSKKKSSKPMNAYMKKASAAAKSGKASFTYNGKTYRKATTKSGLVYYTANKKRSQSPARRSKRRPVRGGGAATTDTVPAVPAGAEAAASVAPTPAQVL